MLIPKADSPGGDGVRKRVTLTETDIRDAARLFRLFADQAPQAGGLSDLPSAKSDSTDRGKLVSRARTMLTARRLRERHFNRIMFGEPAWDILLMLYLSEQSSGRLTMSRLAVWVETPLTTVVRWVNFLEEQGLVERRAHPTDRRTLFINLSEQGRAALDSYFGAITDL